MARSRRDQTESATTEKRKGKKFLEDKVVSKKSQNSKHKESSKDRLKRLKVALAARTAQAKREKVKSRKQAKAKLRVGNDGAPASDTKTTSADNRPVRKRVSFAS
ncbi:hypothetical protein WOLCODRAFT_149445 [Wolfiporia cocos MD-104 SS10]|uniref:Uncharacterized protein n=1 Tax=Wolfiporia cocos (strain MD-104) TaxID=742152 RepID=A0A2H3JR72_WOLCO|nr:hypothetical protein WOLCODRAFT_149445 [Wolfiporia cocos MD-104 SS10]